MLLYLFPELVTGSPAFLYNKLQLLEQSRKKIRVFEFDVCFLLLFFCVVCFRGRVNQISIFCTWSLYVQSKDLEMFFIWSPKSRSTVAFMHKKFTKLCNVLDHTENNDAASWTVNSVCFGLRVLERCPPSDVRDVALLQMWKSTRTARKINHPKFIHNSSEIHLEIH